MTEAFAEGNPEKAQKLYINVDYLKSKGQYQDALDILDEIIKKHDPTHFRPYREAAEIFLSFDQADGAIGILNEYKTNVLAKKGKAEFTAETTLNNDDVKFLVLAGKAHLLKKHYPAVQNFVSLVLKNQHSNTEAVELQADLWFGEKKFPEAIRLYQSLFKQDYHPQQMLFSLALAHNEIDEPEWAMSYITDLQKSMKDPALDELYETTLKALALKQLKMDQSIRFPETLFIRFFPGLVEKKIIDRSNSSISNDKNFQDRFTDPMTGVFAMEAIKVKLPIFHARAKGQFFIGCTDIDYFKSVNDCLGHDIGDETIKAYGKALLEFFPGKVFRNKKGDEFVWCFEGTEKDCLDRAVDFRRHVEDKLRLVINEAILKSPIIDSKTQQKVFMNWDLTCSQGIAEWEDGKEMEKVIKEADLNSYESKAVKVGRNAIFYKFKLLDKGARPIQYNKTLVKHLNLMAQDKGYETWWKMLEKAPMDLRNEVLKAANQASDDEIKKAAFDEEEAAVPDGGQKAVTG